MAVKNNEHWTDLRVATKAARKHEIERLTAEIEADRKAGHRSDRAVPDLKRLSGIVHDWVGLVEIAMEYTNKKGGNWIFRGQQFPHPLVPKVGRDGARRDAITGKAIRYSQAGERWVWEQFVRRSRPYLKQEPKSDLEWLSIAQHHKVPTRLLDWTENFLIAAYFAIAAAGVEGPPTVYAIPRPSYVRNGDQPFKIELTKLYQSPDLSPRITTQRGLFTIHPKPDRPYAPRQLEQWTIDKAACFNIKKQLHLFGINESVIYPDIDGLGAYLAWRYKWPKSIPYERL